jgi:hypothetical protein
LWAVLCFVSATSFFVQKLGNLSVWIFATLAIASIASHRLVTAAGGSRPHRAPQ